MTEQTAFPRIRIVKVHAASGRSLSKSRCAVVWTLSLAFAMALTVGCGDDGGSIVGPKPPARGHHDTLLQSFARAYESAWIAGYEMSIDDDYICVEGGYRIPEDPALEFDKREDVCTTSNMFAHPELKGMRMELNQLRGWYTYELPPGLGDGLGILMEAYVMVVIGDSAGVPHQSTSWMQLKSDFSSCSTTPEAGVFVVDQSNLEFVVMQDRDQPGLWSIYQITELDKEGSQ